MKYIYNAFSESSTTEMKLVCNYSLPAFEIMWWLFQIKNIMEHTSKLKVPYVYYKMAQSITDLKH